MIQIVEYLGVDLATKLVDELGGQVVFVSKDGYISSMPGISASEAESLKNAYAGLNAYIPMKIDNSDIDIRNRQIIDRLIDGASINRVASEFGLSRGHIFKIKRGM